VRTEDQIKDLCVRVIAAEGEELYSTLAELRTVLRTHCEELQNMALASVLKISATPPDTPKKAA
jgi:light-regulated signal transduction histidine kinase (bacteriophytochrome)